MSNVVVGLYKNMLCVHSFLEHTVGAFVFGWYMHSFLVHREVQASFGKVEEYWPEKKEE